MVISAFSLWLISVPAQAAPPGVTIAAAGSDTTMDVMSQILTGTGEYNVLAGPNQSTALNVPGDANCNSVTYHSPASGAEVVPPFGSGQGQQSLRDSVAGTYPNATATNNGALKGCIDIARSSARPNAANDGAIGTAQYYGFALDALTWGSPSLNAPPSMTIQQLRDIYNCVPGANNWSYVGGTPGPIQRFMAQTGSGTRSFFLTNVLGLASTATFPAVGTPGTANYCPAGIDVEENKGNDLLLDSPNNAQYYQQAILPYSAGKFVVQATNRTNPTKDLRAGVRPGGLVLPLSVSGTTPVYAVRWTGSGFLLNNATVNGTNAQVRTLTDAQTAGSLSPLVQDTTLDSASANFTSADIGSTLEGTCVAAGTTILSVNSTTQAVISPASLVTDNACTVKLGPAVVGEKNPQVCSNYPSCTTQSNSNIDVLPGTRLVFNVVNSASPSFIDARNIVGFDNVVGGTKSPLCNGDFKFTIQSEGFLNLPPQTSSGGTTGVTCRRIQ
jgi:hypothetical protein